MTTDGAKNGVEMCLLTIYRRMTTRERQALHDFLEALKAGDRPIEDIAVEFYIACGLTKFDAIEKAALALAHKAPDGAWRECLN
jgi:hypothetical protein